MNVFLVSLGEMKERFGCPLRCLEKTLTIWIFAYGVYQIEKRGRELAGPHAYDLMVVVLPRLLANKPSSLACAGQVQSLLSSIGHHGQLLVVVSFSLLLKVHMTSLETTVLAVDAIRAERIESGF